MIFIVSLFIVFEFYFAVCSFLISTAEKEVRYECNYCFDNFDSDFFGC